MLSRLPTSPAIRNIAIRAASSLSRPNKDVLTVSPRAAGRLSELMRSHSAATDGVRLGVKRRGCNGLSYVMNYQEGEPDKGDEVVEFQDDNNQTGRLVVDKEAVFFVVGTHLDFQEDAMGSEFTFENPNEKGTCGCGESFNV